MVMEKVSWPEREECERIFKGTRVHILGKGTSEKATAKGVIHMMPVLVASTVEVKRKNWKEM
jgi:hypothetical protein